MTMTVKRYKSATTAKDAVGTMIEMGMDPIEAMVKLAQDVRTPINIRETLLKELAKYWTPMKRGADTPMPQKVEITWRAPKK